MRTIKVLAAGTALLLSSAAIAGPAAKGGASDSNYCWGKVSSQLAHVEGGLGSHISEQSEPRLGLGNVARVFFDMGLIDEPSVSALGTFLASLDEYDETSCPA